MNAELITALRNCSSPTVGSCMDCPYYKGVSCKWQMMEDAADALEAAEKRIAELEKQLPKEGEWIEVHDWLHIPQEERGTYRCSACGQVMKYPWSYCPNCGARMQTVTDCHTLEEGEQHGES